MGIKPPVQPPAGTQVLVPTEAAGYLRLDTATVYEMLKGGELPGRKVRGRWRILRSDLDAYLRGEWQSNGGERKTQLARTTTSSRAVR